MKKQYTKEEKIAFYKAKLAALENKTLSERVLDLENRIFILESVICRLPTSAEKTGTKES